MMSASGLVSHVNLKV